MQLDRGTYRCDHCGDHFPRPNLCGRKPSYCGRTCRQRAYEHRRRGQLRVGLPTIDLVPARPDPRRTPRYEAGASRGRFHQLRPEGLPDPRRRRPTLCGTYARPLPANAHPAKMHPCRTCRRVADRHPAASFHDPAADVAVLRTVLARLRHPHEDHHQITSHLLHYCFPAA